MLKPVLKVLPVTQSHSRVNCSCGQMLTLAPRLSDGHLGTYWRKIRVFASEAHLLHPHAEADATVSSPSRTWSRKGLALTDCISRPRLPLPSRQGLQSKPQQSVKRTSNKVAHKRD